MGITWAKKCTIRKLIELQHMKPLDHDMTTCDFDLDFDFYPGKA